MLVLFVLSCKKEKKQDVPTDCSGQWLIVKSHYENSSDTTFYEYDKQNRISKIYNFYQDSSLEKSYTDSTTYQYEGDSVVLAKRLRVSFLNAILYSDVIKYTLNEKKLASKQEGPLNNITTFVYDVNGFLIQKSDGIKYIIENGDVKKELDKGGAVSKYYYYSELEDNSFNFFTWLGKKSKHLLNSYTSENQVDPMQSLLYEHFYEFECGRISSRRIQEARGSYSSTLKYIYKKM